MPGGGLARFLLSSDFSDQQFDVTPANIPRIVEYLGDGSLSEVAIWTLVLESR